MAFEYLTYKCEPWEQQKSHAHPAEFWLGGKKIGMLTLLEDLLLTKENGLKVRGVRFRCDCGNEIVRPLHQVKRSREPSCGCFRPLSGKHKITHGGRRANSSQPEYCSWTSAKARCTNPKTEGYNQYGGRGITICERWADSYENFIEDMGKKPYPSYTLDRIDNEKGYFPENCRWASKTTQAQNRRNVIWIEVNGEKMTASAFRELTLLSEFKIKRFLDKGVTGDEIIRHMHGVLGNLIKP